MGFAEGEVPENEGSHRIHYNFVIIKSFYLFIISCRQVLHKVSIAFWESKSLIFDGSEGPDRRLQVLVQRRCRFVCTRFNFVV